jgi:hypothetical protein
MSSPWDPAISQAMQRHGGSNRSVPKQAAKPRENEAPLAPVAPGYPAGEEVELAVIPESPTGGSN